MTESTMNLTIIKSPVLGGGAWLPSSPSRTGDFNFPPNSESLVGILTSSGGEFGGIHDPKKKGLGSNGKGRQERDGLSSTQERHILHQKGRFPVRFSAIVKTGYESAEDSRQVPSPMPFPAHITQQNHRPDESRSSSKQPGLCAVLDPPTNCSFWPWMTLHKEHITNSGHLSGRGVDL